MTVTLTTDDGKEIEFEKIKAIIQPTESIIVLEFEEGHNYPANEVYIRVTSGTADLKVSVK